MCHIQSAQNQRKRENLEKKLGKWEMLYRGPGARITWTLQESQKQERGGNIKKKSLKSILSEIYHTKEEILRQKRFKVTHQKEGQLHKL